MAVTTGIDIVHIPTFGRSLQTGGQVFKDKLFTPKEQSLFTTVESLAGIFAGKEAIAKALPDMKLTPSLIQISKEPSGKPVTVDPKLDPALVDISISHDADYAIAICVILKP